MATYNDFRVGDAIRVHSKIVEGEKERVQIFEGTVISISGKGETKSFTVRKIATGAIGVERIWALNSPSIVKVEVKKHGNVKRAKLYYLRQREGKRATKVKTKAEVNVKKS